jgi:type IV pilus assembly protein PilB
MYSNEEFLCQLLQESGLIGDKEIATAKGNQKQGQGIVETLVKTGAVSDEQVAQTVAVNAGMEFVDLHGFSPDPGLKNVVPEDVSRRYKIAPLGMDGTTLQIAVSDPYDFEPSTALLPASFVGSSLPSTGMRRTWRT